MSCRPGWMVALLAMVALLPVVACGEGVDPPGLLGDEPRVLSFRVEVVEPGPLSYGLLPIPADRVRDEALPGDVVELSTWVVSAQREYETAQLDPAWFLCPASGNCMSSLARPSAQESCAEQVPETVACRLGHGESPRFTMPQLTTELPLFEQAFVRIVMIGHTAQGLTTQACVDIVSDPGGSAWDGCTVGAHILPMGPALRLHSHALDLGLDVPVPGLPDGRDELVAPHFNPEVTSIRLVPVFSDGSRDSTRVVEASPGEVAILEPGYVYAAIDAFDPRDRQPLVSVGPDDLSADLVSPRVTLTTGTPGVLRPVSSEQTMNEFAFTRRIVAPQDPSSFSVHLVLTSPAGGGAWATYLFEVPEP